jgi:hypothetical protein
VSKHIVIQVYKLFDGKIPTRRALENKVAGLGLSYLDAEAAVQNALNDGWLSEPLPGYLEQNSWLKRLWERRPWRTPSPTADEVLESMTLVDLLPPVDGTRRHGSPVSAPCVLAELRHDGSLLEHGEIAMFHFTRMEWVNFPNADRKINFPATHYRIAG